jgi:hypothetical protein
MSSTHGCGCLGSRCYPSTSSKSHSRAAFAPPICCLIATTLLPAPCCGYAHKRKYAAAEAVMGGSGGVAGWMQASALATANGVEMCLLNPCTQLCEHTYRTRVSFPMALTIVAKFSLSPPVNVPKTSRIDIFFEPRLFRILLALFAKNSSPDQLPIGSLVGREARTALLDRKAHFIAFRPARPCGGRLGGP